jgi:hypothetical protein
LPTPCARDGKGRGYQRGLPDLLEHNPTLLPTPTATPYGSNQSPSPGAAVRPSLAGLAPALLPTPTAGGGTGYMSGTHRDTWRPGLELAVQGHQARKARPPARTLLPTPTPTAADARSSANATAGRRIPSVGHAGHTLTDATRLLPTPRTSDGRGPAVHGEGGNDLRTTVAYLPTPRATDGTKGCPGQRGSKGDLTLPSAAVTLNPPHPQPEPDADEPPAWGPYAAAVQRWATILDRPAPPPTQPGTHGKPVLAPAFVEWLMGLPDQWVCGLGLPRTVALKLLGNGVVPHQAAAALRALLIRHHTTTVTP